MELLPPQVLSVSLTPSEVEGGQDVEAEVTLSGPAAAGTNVTFESTNESAEAPEPVTIAAGLSLAYVVMNRQDEFAAFVEAMDSDLSDERRQERHDRFGIES